MPVPTQSEPSTVRVPPQSIRTQLASSTDPMDKTQTPPSAGPGAYDPSVIPPAHDDRTIILCFDGTGDQFDTDVCADTCSQMFPFPHRPLNLCSRRIRTSFSFSRCSKRMIRVSRWFTIRSADARFFVLVMRRFKRRVLGWHWDVHYSGDCDTVLGRRAKEGRHGYCQSP